MCLLSYNSNGLRNLPLEEAIRSVAEAGYDGIELSLHKTKFNPLTLQPQELEAIKEIIASTGLRVSCIAGGTADILSDVMYEPGLIAVSSEERHRRVDLICRTMDVASYLEVPVVNFASGLLPSGMEAETARAHLMAGIKTCINYRKDVILAIEPEPGMFIETTGQAIELIEALDSSRFALNLDIGHVYCCEENYLAKIERALEFSAHIHVEDIRGRIHHHEIPGTGEIDFAAFARLCRQKNYHNFVSVELYHHAEVWPQALQQSKDFLTDILKY